MKEKTIHPNPPLLSPSLNESPGNPSPNLTSNLDDLDVPIATRKGVRSCTQHLISKFVSYSHLSSSYNAFITKLASVSVPNHGQDALMDPKWKNAMIEEMKALYKNSTWELVELPRGHKTVGCKLVFTIKYKADGSIESYKACLVAKGFT